MGSTSHEFMVLANTGEELIVFDPTSSYAANVERAEIAPPAQDSSTESPKSIEKVHTPGSKDRRGCVCHCYTRPQTALVKTLLYKTDQGTIIAVLVRGDHQANEIKIKRQLGVHDLVLANPESVQTVSSAPDWIRWSGGT